jgi:hypothetical protein
LDVRRKRHSAKYHRAARRAPFLIRALFQNEIRLFTQISPDIFYAAAMDLLRPLPATLISLEPGAGAHSRRRLFVTEPAKAKETQVRVAKISTHACVLVELAEPPSDSAQTWLKLPGKEPLRILIGAGAGKELACTFVQPLYPAELDALVAHGGPEPPRRERPRPRCTFI